MTILQLQCLHVWNIIIYVGVNESAIYHCKLNPWYIQCNHCNLSLIKFSVIQSLLLSLHQLTISRNADKGPLWPLSVSSFCHLCISLSVSMDVGQPDLLAGGECWRSRLGQLSRAVSWLHGPRRWWGEPQTCHSFYVFYIFFKLSDKVRNENCLSEMGRVSRNCTEFGWSETSPHYVDVCFFYDNNTKPVSPLYSLFLFF